MVRIQSLGRTLDVPYVSAYGTMGADGGFDMMSWFDEGNNKYYAIGGAVALIAMLVLIKKKKRKAAASSSAPASVPAPALSGPSIIKVNPKYGSKRMTIAQYRAAKKRKIKAENKKDWKHLQDMQARYESRPRYGEWV